MSKRLHHPGRYRPHIERVARQHYLKLSSQIDNVLDSMKSKLENGEIEEKMIIRLVVDRYSGDCCNLELGDLKSAKGSNIVDLYLENLVETLDDPERSIEDEERKEHLGSQRIH